MSLSHIIIFLFFLHSTRECVGMMGPPSNHDPAVWRQLTAAEADTTAFDTVFDLLPGGDGPCIIATDGRETLTFNALREFIGNESFLCADDNS